MNNAKSLIIGAHPDDVEVLMGFAAATNPQNHALIATRGERGHSRLEDVEFVSAGLRILESQKGLEAIGIPPYRQHYRDFADGYLMSQIGHLVTAIVEVAAANGVEQLVTFGPRGFDGHRDHVAVFQAARRAAKELTIKLLVRLDANQVDKIDKTDLILTGDRQLKIKAMRHHLSQYDPETDPATWPNFELYNRQLEREVYKEV
jgi:LmbE family N-acetylglucosaminyl deacetylase